MKVAVIDLGTNTFNLLVRDALSGELILSTKIPVKLGEGGIGSGKIAPAAYQRGMEALRDYHKILKEKQVQEVYALATSAIRGAANRDAFIKEAQKRFGLTINLISGLEEAELIYLGVKNAITFDEAPQLIMDIGGGSTEFIIASQQGILWKNSYDIGSSRLLEKFSPSDPVNTKEIARVEEFLRQHLRDLVQVQQSLQAQSLIGSSGSFESFASIIFNGQGRHEPIPPGESYTFHMEDYHEMAARMMTSTLQQRLETPGMIAMRADMIVMACLLTNLILKELNINQLKLSTYALKEGVFYAIKENRHQWQKSLL